MNIIDLFEYAQTHKRHVWSKRGKGIEKRVEKQSQPDIKGRTVIAVKKDDHAK